MDVLLRWLEDARATVAAFGVEEWILVVGGALLLVCLILWLQVLRQFRIERGIWRLLLDLQYDIRRLRDELSDVDIRRLRQDLEAPGDAPGDAQADAAADDVGERPDAIRAALVSLDEVEDRLRRTTEK